VTLGNLLNGHILTTKINYWTISTTSIVANKHKFTTICYLLSIVLESTIDWVRDSYVISSFRIYASSFPAMMSGKLWDIFVLLLRCRSLSKLVIIITEIFLNEAIRLHLTNAKNLSSILCRTMRNTEIVLWVTTLLWRQATLFTHRGGWWYERCEDREGRVTSGTCDFVCLCVSAV